MSEETGKRIGDYQILNELGSGGMGRVYKVRNVISDRIEAMKVLLPDLAGRQELAARFLREIKLMASLNHPNIAQLRTAFTADNQLVMIMEYVEGTTLAEKLEHGAIPIPDALNYTGQVLSALSYAHQQHIIHRDIKPANIMLTPQGVVKLMDFGIARAGEERNLTMTGTTLGSLSYMSPEQVTAQATDARSDLYSVGVSLYEFVTGQRPFQASSDYSIMAAHVKETPRPPMELEPHIPTELNDIILMAIAKDPAQRFQTADAFRNALASVPVAASTAPSVVARDASGTATVDSVLPPSGFTPAPLSSANRPASTPVAVSAARDTKTPVNITPSIPIPPPAPSGHRGLYMSLGALIVLAVLVAAGIYIPRNSKTQAQTSSPNTKRGSPDSANPPTDAAQSSNAPAPPVTPANPATGAATQATGATASDAKQPAAATPGATTPTDNSKSAQQQVQMAAGRESEKPSAGQEEAAPAKPAVTHAKKMANSGGGSSAQNAASAAPADNSAQLDQLEHEVDQLSTRAAAVNSGLDHLQAQQSAAGYGLRGDMVAKQASMKTNLAKAQEASQHGDVARAEKYKALAAADVEALEHFLGR
jgi:serine/threonine protein kinase